MADWHSKELGDGVETLVPTSEIQESFLTLVQSQARTGHCPLDAAVFSRYDLDANAVYASYGPNPQ